MAVMVTALTRASEHIASPDFANAKLLSIILLFALGQAVSVVFDKIMAASHSRDVCFWLFIPGKKTELFSTGQRGDGLAHGW